MSTEQPYTITMQTPMVRRVHTELCGCRWAICRTEGFVTYTRLAYKIVACDKHPGIVYEVPG